MATSTGLVPLRSDGSSNSLNSVSPNNFSMQPMNFSASSPLLTQGASPYQLVAPAGNFFTPITVSPRFTTPSVSPQPPMVDQTLYISPSPLLLTPQQSTSSVNSDSTTPDIPNMFLNGSTFTIPTLLPPSTSFTSPGLPSDTFLRTSVQHEVLRCQNVQQRKWDLGSALCHRQIKLIAQAIRPNPALRFRMK